MKTQTLAWALAVVALGTSMQLASTGCGSETSNDTPTNADGGDGSSDPNNTNPSGTGIGTGQPVGGVACGVPDAACTTNTQCCSFSCLNGKCSGKQCTADTTACTSDGECCGGKCATTCTPLSATCKTLGNPCTENANCCSALCTNNLCSAPSFCGQNGDACAGDLDCCGGLCTKAAGAALGLCAVADAPGAGQCTTAGQVCDNPTTGGTLPVCGGNCCSKSCRPYAPTKGLVDICQPPSGCHPTGELCQTDTDCCGAAGTPGSTSAESGKSADVTCSKAAGATVGRCDQGKVCSAAGSICRLAAVSCDATDRCCSGTVQQHPLNCKQDLLGIPRCTVASDYDCAVKGPPPGGTVCASSADCCGKPCVPNPAGAGLVCGADACVPTAGACTTTADCCAGSPCNIAAGATKGTCGPSLVGVPAPVPTTPPPGGTTPPPPPPPPPPGTTACAQYGQVCTVAGDCCDGVPCTGGHCVFPGPN